MSMSVSIDTTKLNEIIATVPGNKTEIVKGAAFHILGNARAKAPHVTGWLRDHSDVNSEYSKDGYYNVEFYADYAAYVELGTKKMYARPFLRTAVETERQNFIDKLKSDLIK